MITELIIMIDEIFVLRDFVSRLRYLGYGEDIRSEFVLHTFGGLDLAYYDHIISASTAAGYNHRRDFIEWPRRDLQSPESLPGLFSVLTLRWTDNPA